jgi:cystinosin
VYANFKRKSTHGWAIGMVLCDFLGGVCSAVQLVLEAAITDNWGGLLGDIVKLLLGIISMSFDVIFMVQHYCLYKGADPDDEHKIEMTQTPSVKDVGALEKQLNAA